MEQVTVLQAYFDESERPSGIFCVAGYAFAAYQAKRFIKEWDALFAPFGGFHMWEFVHGRERFAGTSQAQRDQVLHKAVEIINSRMSAGVAVSCNLAEMKALSPKWIRGFGHAYPVCCHWVMTSLSMLLEELGSSEPVRYVFESGHPREAEARDLVRLVSKSEDLKTLFRYYGDAFLPKRDAVPLQAADLLAWEWAKCQDETISRKLRPLRGSLRALLAHAPKRYKVAHCEGDALAKAMNGYRRAALAQIKEES